VAGIGADLFLGNHNVISSLEVGIDNYDTYLNTNTIYYFYCFSKIVKVWLKIQVKTTL
jgi:hypothetical protein